MATSFYLFCFISISFLGDDREHILCVGGIFVCYLLHCLVPFDRDSRIVVRCMGNIGQHPVFNVGFLQIGYIYKFYSSCIKGEQEHVSCEILRLIKIESLQIAQLGCRGRLLDGRSWRWCLIYQFTKRKMSCPCILPLFTACL